jgi:two-component system, chemotaxis family, chemotaxis protein CheY
VVATIPYTAAPSATPTPCMTDAPLVLVVDDDQDSRTLLELALSASGFAVATAANGLDALTQARRANPRLILLDLAMPVMDGFAFRAEQLRDQTLASIPVICVSGRHDAVRVSRGMRVAGCIPKPFDLEVVISSVREIVSV